MISSITYDIPASKPEPEPEPEPGLVERGVTAPQGSPQKGAEKTPKGTSNFFLNSLLFL